MPHEETMIIVHAKIKTKQKQDLDKDYGIGNWENSLIFNHQTVLGGEYYYVVNFTGVETEA